MKSYYYLALLLLGALLTWPACDPVTGDPVEPDECGFTIPTVTYSTGCDPQMTFLRGLSVPQLNERPELPDLCPTDNNNDRIVRLEPPRENDDFYLHLYVGIPATIHLSVFGATCGGELVTLVECESSEAVAISQYVSTEGGAFDAIYVKIDYELFRRDLYADYVIDDAADIGVAAYDELPTTTVIGYNQNDTGPSTLRVNCDGSAFERLVVTSCNPDADVLGYLAELGLRENERNGSGGVPISAIEVPQGMSLNFLSATEPPPGGGGPYTPIRRPKKDSTDFIVEPDYIITLPAADPRQFIPLQECSGQTVDPATIGAPVDNGVENCFNPSSEELACLNWEPRGMEGEGRRMRIAILDSGADQEGELRSVWPRYLPDGEGPENLYVQPGNIGYDFIRGDAVPEDEIGHGTTTASALVGNYRSESPATIYHMKIFGRDNVASYFGAVVAINAAVDADFDLINMSWGLPLAEPPFALSCAMRRALQAEVIVVASAGNESADLGNFPQWPASYSRPALGGTNVMTVGSMVYPDHKISNPPVRAFFSNFGNEDVDVAAYLTAATPAFRGSLKDITFIAGTSLSAPLAAGRLARFVRPGGSVAATVLQDFYANGTKSSDGLLVPGHVERGRFVPLCD